MPGGLTAEAGLDAVDEGAALFDAAADAAADVWRGGLEGELLDWPFTAAAAGADAGTVSSLLLPLLLCVLGPRDRERVAREDICEGWSDVRRLRQRSGYGGGREQLQSRSHRQ